MSKITRTLMPMIAALLLSATLTAQTTRNEQRPRRMDVSTYQNQLKSRENPYRGIESTRETLLEEDFSLFTAGSEQNPDGTNLTDPVTYLVDPNYTHVPGWNGGHVYQAGGVCYFADWYWAYLNTPEFEMTGTVHFSFRARMDASSGQHETTVGLLYDVENPQIIDMATFYMTPEWTLYEFDLYNPESRDVFIQINAYTEWFLDDVVVERELNFTPAPLALPATDYTMEGFTANWGTVNLADSYLLTVFKRDFYGPEQVYVEPESFESINSDGQWIDWSNPNLPEGWTLNLQNGDEREVTNEAYNGNLAICMDAEGDTVVLPSNGGRYLSSNFALRVMEYSMGDDADLEIIGKVGGKWQYTGVFYWASHLYNNYGNEWLTDDMVSWLQNKYDEIGLAYVGEGVVWALDYWDYTTNQACTINTVIEDLEIPATELSYTVTGLNPAEDHYYYVKADSEHGTSIPSNYISCFGMCPPVLGEPSNVGYGTYTANWQAHPKADGYEIHNYKVYTAESDETAHLVFSEDFSKVQNGMPPETPITADDPYLFRLDEFTEQPDWTGAGVVLADGMLGAADNEYYYGRVTTPEITLNNAATFHVKASIYCQEGEQIDIIATTTGETQSRTYTTTGMQIFEADFNAGPDSGRERLKIMDQSGQAFLIDNLQVMQDLHAGDKTYNIVSWDRIEDGAIEHFTYTNLDTQYDWADFAYDLYGIHYAFDKEYQSVNSDYVEATVYLDLDENTDPSVKVYPNPTQGSVTIEAAAMSRVNILTMLGQVVYETEIDGSQAVIDLSRFEAGVYLVQVTTESGVSTRRVTVAR